MCTRGTWQLNDFNKRSQIYVVVITITRKDGADILWQTSEDAVQYLSLLD